MPDPRRLLVIAVVLGAAAGATTAADDTRECPSAPAQAGRGLAPPACWRPYSPDSPFNRRVGDNPRIHPDSDRIVSGVVAFGEPQKGLLGEDTRGDYGHPIYFSEPSDPVFELHCYQRSWGRCEIEGHRIRIPDAAQPAGGGDAHMAVVDAASGWEYDLYKVRSKPPGGGRLEFRFGGRTRIDGDGLGSEATAAGFGELAGLVRAPEAAAGEIRHALVMVAYCTGGGPVPPAQGEGRSCAAVGRPEHPGPPLGGRFWLDMSDDDIERVPGPPIKRTLLRAMAHYGMYVGDTGGGSWGVKFESAQSYRSFGLPDPFVALARRQRLPEYKGGYVLALDGVDWGRRLRLLDPCEATGDCR